MANAGIMKDSYVGGITSSSFIQQTEESPFYVHSKVDSPKDSTADKEKIEAILFGEQTNGWDQKINNQTDEDKIIHLTCTDEAKSTNINQTEEYNVDYTGLSIMPWEEFVFNPRALNDLFFTESNQKITYDPEEVNVFFHGKNVMPPTIGDISENGKSWNVEVETINDLRKVRTLLTEKCSIFGVTLQYKERRFSKPLRAPCVVLLDPNHGGIGDKLYSVLTRAMDTLHNRRRVCVEINLNACVERWCRRVMLTDCKAIGAKLIITNGEEYTSSTGVEDIVCCVVCFPIWLLQTGIYKLHRHVTYDDYRMDFDAEEMFLHGLFQDAHYQRHQIFKEDTDEIYFRTRSTAQTDVRTLQNLGIHKFVCVKKIERESGDNASDVIKEHKVVTFGDLVDKRKDRVKQKEKKTPIKSKPKESASTQFQTRKHNQGIGVQFEIGESVTTANSSRENSRAYINEGFQTADENETSEDDSKAEILPEVTSVLCEHEDEGAIDVEIPEDVSQTIGLGKNACLKSTDSMDQEALAYKKLYKRRKRVSDNKSITAVCSFELLDSEVDTDIESDENYKENELDAAENQNLFEEVLKIDKTLPPLQKETTSKDVEGLREEEEMTEKTKHRSKSKNKPKVGSVLKDLIRTTETTDHLESLPSAKDERYQKSNVSKSKNKNHIKDDVSKDSQNGVVRPEKSSVEEVEIPSESRGGINATSSNTPNDNKQKNPISQSQKDKKACRAEILYSNRTSKKVQEKVGTSASIEASSSDGDDVEVIYQSPKTKFAKADIEDFSEDETQKGDQEEGLTNRNIDHVIEANRIKVDAGRERKVGKSADVYTIRIDEETPSRDESVTFPKDPEEQSNIEIYGNKLFGIRMVETPLDITDVDDKEEENQKNPPTFQSEKVPPLNLNIGETLGKKAKRGTKQYNSKRKYLGMAMNNTKKTT